MNDSYIIELFTKRDERAIEETERQYGSYCTAIANRILQSREDAEECLNDTLLIAWNHIPPENPRYLAQYLGTITRKMALQRYRNQRRQKRGGKKELDLALEELEAILPTQETPEGPLLQKELSFYINRFLATLPQREQGVLVCRYYHFYSTEEIATAYHLRTEQVRQILSRTLKKLRKFLEKEKYL